MQFRTFRLPSARCESLGWSIDSVGLRLAPLAIVMVTTDGVEDSSSEYNQTEDSAVLRHLRETV